MSVMRTSAIALGALAVAAGLAGIVLVDRPAAVLPPTPKTQSGLGTPVDPLDPDAILVQAEPSRDGRWLAFGLDVERIAGAQSLYLTSLTTGELRYVSEGVLAPTPWDDDGLLVFIDRSSDAARACWLDASSFEIVRTASPRELSGQVDPSLDAPQWAERTQSRRADGGFHERIAWRGQNGVLELETQSLFDVEISAVAGVVFELRRDAASRSLLRHDLRSGVATTLCKSKDLALFRVSPDGDKLLTSERADGRVSFVARRASDGSELCEPWFGERVSAVWLMRSDSRYVLLSIGDTAQLIDLTTDESTPLGSHSAGALDLRVLNDGRILRRAEHSIDLLDRHGAVSLPIFPPRR